MTHWTPLDSPTGFGTYAHLTNCFKIVILVTYLICNIKMPVEKKIDRRQFLTETFKWGAGFALGQIMPQIETSGLLHQKEKPTPTSPYREHSVTLGESLFSIALNENTTSDVITQLTNAAFPDKVSRFKPLLPGQKLLVKPDCVFTTFDEILALQERRLALDLASLSERLATVSNHTPGTTVRWFRTPSADEALTLIPVVGASALADEWIPVIGQIDDIPALIFIASLGVYALVSSPKYQRALKGGIESVYSRIGDLVKKDPLPLATTLEQNRWFSLDHEEAPRIIKGLAAACHSPNIIIRKGDGRSSGSVEIWAGVKKELMNATIGGIHVVNSWEETKVLYGLITPLASFRLP